MKLLLTATAVSALILGANLAPVHASDAAAKDAAAKAECEVKPKVQAKKRHVAKKHHRSNELQDLQAQVTELMQKIDQLERRPNLTDKEAVTDGTPDKVSLKISGEINKAALWADNGRNSHIQYVDNDNRYTQVDMTATAKWNEDTTVGGTVAMKINPNSSNSTDIRNTDTGNENVSVYKSEVFVDNKRFGMIQLGRGQMASDATMEATDFSGTDVVAIGASVYEMAGGINFVNKNAANGKFNLSTNGVNGNGTSTTPVLVNSIFADVDGAAEQDRVTYHTPEFMGFKLGAGHAYRASNGDRTGNDLWDVALKYAGEFFGHKFAAQVAYVHDNTSPQVADNLVTGYDQVNGSAGVLFSNGLNLFVSGSHRNWDFSQARDAHSWQIKPGYRHKFFECGHTNFALDYAHFENFTIDASAPARIKDKYKGDSWGAFIVQDFDRIATQVYLGYRHYDPKVKGNAAVKLRNVDAVMGGMSVKF